MNERPTMRQFNDRKYVLYFNIVQKNLLVIGGMVLLTITPMKLVYCGSLRTLVSVIKIDTCDLPSSGQ